MLRPELPHNRARYDQVAGHRLSAFVVAVIVLVGIAFVGPPQHAWTLFLAALGVFVIALIVIEAKLLLLFKRDLRERNHR